MSSERQLKILLKEEILEKFYEKTIQLNNLFCESLRAATDANPARIHTRKRTHNVMAVIGEVIDDSWEGWKRSGRVEGRGFIRGA